MSRQFDIIVWGATGFTGVLVAEYLAKSDVEGLTWGIAGRDEKKLETVKSNLVQKFGSKFESLEIRQANSSDQSSLDELTSQTRVIITTVGPYQRYGTKLVDSCVRNRTHYCDLTGESIWIKSIIDTYHDQARENGVFIVNCCGFDSIPSDLGVFVLHNYLQNKDSSDRLKSVKYILDKVKGGASGGTIESVLNLFDQFSKEQLKKTGDPYFLNPPNTRGIRQPDSFGLGYDKDIKKWTCPFVMAQINTRIVRRSNGLLGNVYGENFCYLERKACRNIAVAFLEWFFIGLFLLLVSFTFTRTQIVRKVVPKPGQGPDEKLRREGFFKIKIFAETEKRKLVARVEGVADPGYGETSKMIAESALCLALDQDKLSQLEGGVVTPASCMGMTLVERLQRAGMTFEVQEE